METTTNRSGGPRTEEGKTRTRFNAVLLNSGFFLPHDDFPQAAVGS
jgi:hypothetical protein